MISAVDNEARLSSLDPAQRRAALDELRAAPAPRAAPADGNVNMHFHSFFSFNSQGFSPSRIAWEATRQGLYAAGLCDFDVLDGLEEFAAAGRALALRTAVHLETRAFLSEYANADISSPGEPGITYIMGAGFAGLPEGDAPPAAGLADLRARARQRNIDLVSRINGHLGDIAIDYDLDVSPLTPAGTATERHIVRAYVNRAADILEHPDAVGRRWAEILDLPFEKVILLMADAPSMEDKVRARLVKRGGIGYEQPSPDTFPTVETFMEWVRSCGAIPTITWLDGTSDGESDPEALLDCMAALGAAAINIIPDRNWNVADPSERDWKRENLRRIVELADARGLPINVGTEMNKSGLPFVDDLAGEVLSAYRRSFIRGAGIMVGHSLLLRYADYSYVGPAAEADFPSVTDRNNFFEAVGALGPADDSSAAMLESMGAQAALDFFRRSADHSP